MSRPRLKVYFTRPLPKQRKLAPRDPSATKAGQMIRRARVRLHLSQHRFAMVIGCAPGLISRWESGHRKPGRTRLLLLRGALGLSFSEFMTLTLLLNAARPRE